MRIMKAKKNREEEGERIEKWRTDRPKERDRENDRTMKIRENRTLLSPLYLVKTCS